MSAWLLMLLVFVLLVGVEWFTYRQISRKDIQRDALRRHHTGRKRL